MRQSSTDFIEHRLSEGHFASLKPLGRKVLPQNASERFFLDRVQIVRQLRSAMAVWLDQAKLSLGAQSEKATLRADAHVYIRSV
jgi:hypothetical protein